MSFALWRTLIVMTLAIAVGLLAARFIDPASRLSPPAKQDSHFASRLSLIRQATTGELISLQIAPFEVGPNELRVTLLSPLGRPLAMSSALLRLSRLESSEKLAETDSQATGLSMVAALELPATGWWQIDVTVNSQAAASFHLKLDQPSLAPTSFAPPVIEADPAAGRLFQSAVARYEGLAGLMWKEELTSGEPGPEGAGIWFVTNIVANRNGYHATTTNMLQNGSELYSDSSRQCFREFGEHWRCTDGPPPIGPFDLSYLRSAAGFQMGREEVVDGERTQVILFYNPPQGAWYAWWVGEQTKYIRRQVMIANGHFMLDRYAVHDVPPAIQPKDLFVP